MRARLIAVTSATALHHGTYHHGDLPNALRRAAVEVIDERGVAGFSLREVARRAGVSHTAPAHHFGDVRGLLTSVAAEGFEELHRACVDATEGLDDPVEVLQALGRAYVGMAKSHRGHCEVMFRTDIIDTDNTTVQECGLEAYADLENAVAALIAAEGLRVPLDDATWMCWSTMQGLVQLEEKIRVIAELKGGDTVTTDDLITRFMNIVLSGLRNA
jgi:AcrR family transcriptional regulator